MRKLGDMTLKRAHREPAVTLLMWAIVVVGVTQTSIWAIDCPPNRNCDAVRDCSLQKDTRDCEPHWGCDCKWWDPRCSKLICEAGKGLYKSKCETEKAAQNAGYAVAKATCETQKTATKFDCERIKEQERIACVTIEAFHDPLRAVADWTDHVADETTEIGMRILPGDVRLGVEHLTKEVMNEIEKFPVGASLLSTVLKVTHPIESRAIDRIVRRSCDAPRIVARLSPDPQIELDRVGRNLGALTTPLKRLGISGWNMTGCAAQGDAVLKRDAAHSADGFWTIDVQLKRLTIDGLEAPPGRYIRIEVERGMPANAYCDQHQLKQGDRVIFGGPVLIDDDFPHPFLEVHPISDFHQAADLLPEVLTAIAPPPAVWPRSYTVVKGDCLAWIAERTYGTQAWGKVYRANKRLIKDPERIYPGRVLTLVE